MRGRGSATTLPSPCRFKSSRVTMPKTKEARESAQRVPPALPRVRAASRTSPAPSAPSALPAAQNAVRRPNTCRAPPAGRAPPSRSSRHCFLRRRAWPETGEDQQGDLLGGERQRYERQRSEKERQRARSPERRPPRSVCCREPASSTRRELRELAAKGSAPRTPMRPARARGRTPTR